MADFEQKQDLLDNWVINLAFILVGYSTVFIPGYYIIKYVKKRNFNTDYPGEFFNF